MEAAANTVQRTYIVKGEGDASSQTVGTLIKQTVGTVIKQSKRLSRELRLRDFAALQIGIVL